MSAYFPVTFFISRLLSWLLRQLTLKAFLNSPSIILHSTFPAASAPLHAEACSLLQFNKLLAEALWLEQ